MALYLGNSKKLKINSTIGSKVGVCNLIIPSFQPITSSIMLLTSDNYILQDTDGVYLITKEDN